MAPDTAAAYINSSPQARRKQPWFKFYASDYLLDDKADDMPREAEGLLHRMWMICHLEGSCPADVETLARKTHCNLQYVSQWKLHCDPFFKLQDGRLHSNRMEREKQLSEKNRQNAKKRYEHKPKSKSESESESESGNATRNASRIATRTATSFTPPTIAEVQDYCREPRERKNDVDPERFVDYYTARGWVHSDQSPMRDWKATIRNWERRVNNNGNGNGNDNSSSVIDRERAIARDRMQAN